MIRKALLILALAHAGFVGMVHAEPIPKLDAGSFYILWSEPPSDSSLGSTKTSHTVIRFLLEESGWIKGEIFSNDEMAIGFSAMTTIEAGKLDLKAFAELMDTPLEKIQEQFARLKKIGLASEIWIRADQFKAIQKLDPVAQIAFAKGNRK